jgi:hypothetical protein
LELGEVRAGGGLGGLPSKIHLACDGHGLPLAFTVTASNINDCTRLIEVVEAISIRRAGPGRPRTRPGHLIADKGYSTGIIRDYLRRRRIPHTMAERSDQVAARARRGCRLGLGDDVFAEDADEEHGQADDNRRGRSHGPAHPE